MIFYTDSSKTPLASAYSSARGSPERGEDIKSTLRTVLLAGACKRRTDVV